VPFIPLQRTRYMATVQSYRSSQGMNAMDGQIGIATLMWIRSQFNY
jgi:hypothetical protein